MLWHKWSQQRTLVLLGSPMLPQCLVGRDTPVGHLPAVRSKGGQAPTTTSPTGGASSSSSPGAGESLHPVNATTGLFWPPRTHRERIWTSVQHLAQRHLQSTHHSSDFGFNPPAYIILYQGLILSLYFLKLYCNTLRYILMHFASVIQKNEWNDI